MLRPGNKVRDKLDAGAPVVGLVSRIFSPTVAELAGLAGFDYIWIDMEHGSASFETAENMVRAADAVHMEAMIRVPDKAPSSVLRALETGASIICVPQVDTAQEAAAIAQAARYHPQGLRGYSTGGRGVWYGLQETGQALLDRANARILLMAQIETNLGLANAEAICAVPGIDIVFIGLGDLSQQLGVPGNFNHPDVLAASRRIIAAAQAAGKHVGVPAADAAAMRPWLDQGVRFFFCAVDVSLLAQAMKAALQRCIAPS